jgi:transcription initiation factor TFIIH subunit 1
MSGPMEGVEILQNGDVSEYSNVIYKKRVGDLTVSPTNMVFRSRRESGNAENATTMSIEWKDVVKHQVSPANYPKALLKVILAPNQNSSVNTNKANVSTTFQMEDREELERIRKDVTYRLQRHANRDVHDGTTTSTTKKRPYSEFQSVTTSFGELDPTAVAVTRSALLAANAALRQQHKYLVTETSTVAEEDFWKTHQHLLEDEYARISGMARAGTSSVLQSHLPSSGRVTLGVQEMRQIFILYPAVHRAYEEKVPLELSDEQFWRKYLESEYFHRDRGRMGTAARNHAPAETVVNDDKKNKNKNAGPTLEQQEARAAAVGTDDFFSRYDQKLQEESSALAADPQPTGQSGGSAGTGTNDSLHRKWGTHLAVGQFDLTSTLETERGNLLEGPKDNHPPNQNDDGKGARVIQKYNRHWAMVLHPDEAIAGSNLMEVARRSVLDVLPDDTDASVMGGVDEETRRLIVFADAPEEEANHATCVGLQDGNEYEPLTLQNVEAYYAGRVNSATAGGGGSKELNEEAAKRHTVFAREIASKAQSLVNKLATRTDGSTPHIPETCFPPAGLGRELLSALTKKMAKDAETEAQSLEMVNKLPEEFRNRLQSYFRRSSELLRHFFGLRRLEAEGGGDGGDASSSHNSQKLARIVRGMETFYREMEGMRRDFPQTEIGEMMRKMCLPIMDQLDWAFKLHREGSGSGGGGGFVTVEEL